VATAVLVRRLGVVASTTVLAVGAFGGIAAAAPGGVAGTHGTAGTAGTSGDVTQPQPVSTADANDGGANGQCPGGPYCSTRDGSPSGNGNGGGKATGKPCAGCVGKADNKNPKGQLPGGSDHNAGYECDRNHGIGRSNPAHTGCTTPSSTAVTCPSGQVMLAGTCTAPDTSSGTGVLGSGATNGEGTGATAGANLGAGAGAPTGSTPAKQGTAAGVPTSVLGERVVRTPSVAGAAASLPFTGAPTGELLVLAAAALTVGGALAAAGRRLS